MNIKFLIMSSCKYFIGLKLQFVNLKSFLKSCKWLEDELTRKFICNKKYKQEHSVNENSEIVEFIKIILFNHFNQILLLQISF